MGNGKTLLDVDLGARAQSWGFLLGPLLSLWALRELQSGYVESCSLGLVRCALFRTLSHLDRCRCRHVRRSSSVASRQKS